MARIQSHLTEAIAAAPRARCLEKQILYQGINPKSCSQQDIHQYSRWTTSVPGEVSLHQDISLLPIGSLAGDIRPTVLQRQ